MKIYLSERKRIKNKWLHRGVYFLFAMHFGLMLNAIVFTHVLINMWGNKTIWELIELGAGIVFGFDKPFYKAIG